MIENNTMKSTTSREGYSRGNIGVLLNTMDQKKGQVTIFIILGIVIVLAILAVFFFREDIIQIFKGDVEVQIQISSCVKEAIEPSIPKILDNAGDLEPELKIRYHGEEYNYLCYQKSDYLSCINTHPLLKKTATEALIEDTQEKVENCFTEVIEDLEARGYDVEEGELGYFLKLVPGDIIVTLKKTLEISREDTTESYEDFSFEITSRTYELLSLNSEIVNQEAQYCYFDYNSYMLLYPKYTITRTDYNFSKIYTILHEETNEKTKFAVRSCVIPPGI